MAEPRLPATAQMGALHLRTRDASALARYYQEAFGLQAEGSPAALTLRPGDGEPLVVLHEASDAPPRAPGSTGLYHVALLLPTREDLARLLRRLVARGVGLEGAADHAVSEALYLSDPEGNGIELYADRPRDTWPREGGGVGMTTRPLDVDGLLASASGESGMPSGTRVGHVHLQVDDVPAAERFYVGLLGLELTARYGDAASFYAAGGYHHHSRYQCVGCHARRRPRRTRPRAPPRDAARR